MDKVAGILEITHNDKGEIIVNHPDLKPDKDGVGHIVFSVRQATNFAGSIMRHVSQVLGKIGNIDEPDVLLVIEELEPDAKAWKAVEFGSFVAKQEAFAQDLLKQFQSTYKFKQYRIARYKRDA